jgi:hypothetical protein
MRIFQVRRFFPDWQWSSFTYVDLACRKTTRDRSKELVLSWPRLVTSKVQAKLISPTSLYELHPSSSQDLIKVSPGRRSVPFPYGFIVDLDAEGRVIVVDRTKKVYSVTLLGNYDGNARARQSSANPRKGNDRRGRVFCS